LLTKISPVSLAATGVHASRQNSSGTDLCIVLSSLPGGQAKAYEGARASWGMN
jgi:hypothetical protein